MRRQKVTMKTCTPPAPDRVASRRSVRASMALVMLATVGTTIATPAIADTAEDLRSVVTQARSAVCGPLHPEPLAERTAAVAIRSTYDYLNHNARAVPLV